jgi:hypothetical protein
MSLISKIASPMYFLRYIIGIMFILPMIIFPFLCWLSTLKIGLSFSLIAMGWFCNSSSVPWIDIPLLRFVIVSTYRHFLIVSRQTTSIILISFCRVARAEIFDNTDRSLRCFLNYAADFLKFSTGNVFSIMLASR